MAILTEAIAPIRALGKQAVSYGGSVARSGMRVAAGVTRNALGHGLTYYAGGGALIGGIAGGLDAQEGGGNRMRGVLKGAAYGGAAGAGLRLGMSAMGTAGRRGMRAFGMRVAGGVGGGMKGAAARAAGSTNYFRAMAGDFERAGGFSAMRGGAGLGYGRARSAASAIGNRVAGTATAGRAAGYAGRAVGSVRGAYGWARGMASDAASKYTDMGKYYAGL